MSRESRQRLRGNAKNQAHCRQPRKTFRLIVSCVLAVFITGGGLVWLRHRSESPAKEPVGNQNTTFKPPSNYAELCAVSTNDLGKCDIALMNLLCAEGLRGSESLNVSNCLTVLDNMAKAVDDNTRLYYYKFREHPEEFNHSEAYYRMMTLVTVLQQDFGIRYDPSRMSPPTDPEPEEKFFGDSRDIFIHGLVANKRSVKRPGFYRCS